VNEVPVVFEAFWMPRWFGHDPAVARSQVDVFVFRSLPEHGGITVLAAGPDGPRRPLRCRVRALRHPELGALAAIEPGPRHYLFRRLDGTVVTLAAEGGCVRQGLSHPPADWTVRVAFEALGR